MGRKQDEQDALQWTAGEPGSRHQVASNSKTLHQQNSFQSRLQFIRLQMSIAPALQMKLRRAAH